MDSFRIRHPFCEEVLPDWELRFIEEESGDGGKFADLAGRRPNVVYAKKIEPLANHRTQGYHKTAGARKRKYDSCEPSLMGLHNSPTFDGKLAMLEGKCTTSHGAGAPLCPNL